MISRNYFQKQIVFMNLFFFVFNEKENFFFFVWKIHRTTKSNIYYTNFLITINLNICKWTLTFSHCSWKHDHRIGPFFSKKYQTFDRLIQIQQHFVACGEKKKKPAGNKSVKNFFGERKNSTTSRIDQNTTVFGVSFEKWPIFRYIIST